MNPVEGYDYSVNEERSEVLCRPMYVEWVEENFPGYFTKTF